jgi:hypothetical protein
VALHVRASNPGTLGDGVPWPEESRLIGERTGMVREDASPTAAADECLRPAWETVSVIDWDRCAPDPVPDVEPSTTAEPTAAA